MFRARKVFYVLIILLISVNSIFAGISRDEMANDFEFIVNKFKSSYAPVDWKTEHYNLNLDGKLEEGKSKILNSDTFTLKDYQLLLKDLFDSTKDYHVGYSFYHTEKASLPFTVKGVGDKYFIVHINRSKLNNVDFPFSIGDELVEFDGVPTSKAVGKVFNNTIINVEQTDKALSELSLTLRRASKLEEVPKGPITITVKPQGSEELISRQLIWEYEKEEINDPFDSKAQFLSVGLPYDQIRLFNLIDTKMTANQNILELSSSENPYGLGNRESFLPELGEIVWESDTDNFFHSYIYKNNNSKLIGYIRIHTWDFGGLLSLIVNPDAKTPTEQFAEVVSKFEKLTDALVIDQNNNPGGSVSHLYGLASMLTTKPLDIPKHEMALNQEEIASALEALDKLDDSDEYYNFMSKVFGMAVGKQWNQFLKNIAQFKIDEWNAGKTRTSPYFIMGVDKINPHPDVNYTKPIIVLTNSLDFSGGDFFPAIMQDNKRATIMGARTAGAGGYVHEMSYPNLFGLISFSYTASIAERTNKNPIENLGVTPDVELELTENDLQANYIDYIKAVNEKVNELLG